MKTAERLLGDGQMGTEQIDPLENVWKNQNPGKSEPRPARMVLLENFGPAFAEAASRRQGRTSKI